MRLILPDKRVRVTGNTPDTLDHVLLREGINPLEVMATRGGCLLTEDTVISGDDEIRIIRISHGG